jgi:hypothetical protein
MRHLIAAVAAALMFMAAGHAFAQTTSAAAAQAAARHRAASGGAAWNLIRGLHETGVTDGVAYESWHDPVRYGLRLELATPAGKRVSGTNGVGEWIIEPDRTIRGRADPAATAQVRTNAYLGAWGWLFPSRFATDTAHLGTRQHAGRSYEVIRVHPQGGEPRELWFDRRTDLLARIVNRTGAAPVTIEVSDYRRVGKLLLPFRWATDYGGRVTVRQAQSIELEPADRARFSWTPADGTYIP